MKKCLWERAVDWLLSNDTGASSRAILIHMLGYDSPSAVVEDDKEHGCHPHDPSDLGRCLRLLNLFPEWKPRIEEMAGYNPGWKGLVAEWNDLTESMESEVGLHWEKAKSAPKTYRSIKLAIANGYRNDPEWECTFRDDRTLSSAHKINGKDQPDEK